MQLLDQGRMNKSSLITLVQVEGKIKNFKGSKGKKGRKQGIIYDPKEVPYTCKYTGGYLTPNYDRIRD